MCVRLVGGKANLDFCRFAITSLEHPSVSELLILNSLFFHRDQTLEEIQKLIQSPQNRTEQILVALNKKGLLEIKKDRHSVRYFLKGSVHPVVGRAVKPPRMSKDEMKSFKIQILDELSRRSPMSKADIADSVGLSPPQTYRLLKDLEDEKKVSMRSKLWAIVTT